MEIRHGAFPTSRFLHMCKCSDSAICNYYDELDDSFHIFCYMQVFFHLTQSLIRKLTPTIDKIVYSRFNKNRSNGTHSVVTQF